MQTTPPLVIIEPQSKAQSAVIWLHGLGADAHDFEGIVSFLPIEKHGVRMIFPNAPKRPVTINGGFEMPAWYDISDLNLRNADKEGIAESQALIDDLIDEQIAAGIPSDKIVVAGFSQGGAMALHAGLRYEKELAGILALSCYLLDRDTHKKYLSQANIKTPIWMAHGKHDEVVSYGLGESSANFLSEQGHNITFMTYPMTHEVIMDEIHVLADWLSLVLK